MNINCVPMTTVIPGTEAVHAVHMDYACPLGFIYYRQVLGNHFEIMDCYVVRAHRRKCILTAMFTFLRSQFPDAVFITEEGNDESTPWLLKMGFEKRVDGWWLGPVNAAKQSAGKGKL